MGYVIFVVCILLSGLIGGLCGFAFGLAGLAISIPVGILLGFFGGLALSDEF